MLTHKLDKIKRLSITVLLSITVSGCSQKFDEQKLIYYERCKDTILAHFDFFMNHFRYDTIFMRENNADGSSLPKVNHIDKVDFFCADKQRLIALENVEGGMFLKDFNRILWEKELITDQSKICALGIEKDSTIYFTLSRKESSHYNEKYVIAYDKHNEIKEVKMNEKVEGLKNAYTASDLRILFSKEKWKYYRKRTPHVE